MKLLKIFLGIIFSLGLIALIAFLIINSQGVPTYKVEQLKYVAQSTPESIERGRKLANLLCVNCHMDRETGLLTGAEMLDAPPEFGFVYAPNITQDPEYGIGNYTDGELLYLFRTGIKNNGEFAPAYMPKFPNMADSDLEAIIAYLRSDHEEIAPAAVADKPSEPSFLTKLLCRIAWKPLPLPEQSIELPDSADVLALGEYLTINLECWTCHSSDFKKLDLLEPKNTPGFLGGGNEVYTLEGDKLVTQNLTSHETGIGEWTKEEFHRAMKFGLKEGEPALRYPMMPYSVLEDHEIFAIYEYLQTTPPIDNAVGRTGI